MIAGNKRDMSISMLRANLIPLLIGIPIAIAQIISSYRSALN